MRIPDLMVMLGEAARRGMVRAVGVSNYSADQMHLAQDALAKYGITLASNQVEYSLLQRAPEKNGVMAACKELGVTLIAYSPLAMGVLTGKYTSENPLSGMRGLRYNRQLDELQPLLQEMKAIGEAHEKTTAQVALNWIICKGGVPIPGAKNARQVLQNAGALGWRLTEAEIERLDEFSSRAVS
jgi:aryl-alcohol dehydrogenase-like predicted oxidoreductase